MANVTFEWLEHLLDDVSTRAPLGLNWSADRPELPIAVRVTPADYSSRTFEVADHGLDVPVEFSAELQSYLSTIFAVPVPPRRKHRVALVARQAEANSGGGTPKVSWPARWVITARLSGRLDQTKHPETSGGCLPTVSRVAI